MEPLFRDTFNTIEEPKFLGRKKQKKNIRLLNDELIQYVFGFMMDDLNRVSLVSRNWYQNVIQIVCLDITLKLPEYDSLYYIIEAAKTKFPDPVFERYDPIIKVAKTNAISIARVNYVYLEVFRQHNLLSNTKETYSLIDPSKLDELAQKNRLSNLQNYLDMLRHGFLMDFPQEFDEQRDRQMIQYILGKKTDTEQYTLEETLQWIKTTKWFLHFAKNTEQFSFSYVRPNRNYPLSEIPEMVTLMTKLHNQDYENCKLAFLPSSLFKSNYSLTTLRLGNNGLEFISTEIKNLKNLINLDLNHNKLKDFPEGVLSLTNLKTLCLEGNQIGEVPRRIALLSSLVFLSLKRNKIAFLPMEMSRLYGLKNLDISGNQISSLPNGIEGMKLKNLYIGENSSVVVSKKLKALVKKSSPSEDWDWLKWEG